MSPDSPGQLVALGLEVIVRRPAMHGQMVEHLALTSKP